MNALQFGHLAISILVSAKQSTIVFFISSRLGHDRALGLDFGRHHALGSKHLRARSRLHVAFNAAHWAIVLRLASTKAIFHLNVGSSSRCGRIVFQRIMLKELWTAQSLLKTMLRPDHIADQSI